MREVCPCCGGAGTVAASVVFDPASCLVTCGENAVSLTAQEAAVFWALARAASRFLRSGFLVDEMPSTWADPDGDRFNHLRCIVSRLRGKLTPLPVQIESKWGVGYRLTACVAILRPVEDVLEAAE